MEQKKINCFQCKNFYITWDKNFPNGCKAFGFKSRQLPSLLVRETDGKACLAFSPKQKGNFT
ncbi:MAG TPA: uracil-DNA glycosylase [Firmicutes bacterium]|nr:uracil-DNA glycosylase [Bacillota bacterium]